MCGITGNRRGKDGWKGVKGYTGHLRVFGQTLKKSSEQGKKDYAHLEPEDQPEDAVARPHRAGTRFPSFCAQVLLHAHDQWHSAAQE